MQHLQSIPLCHQECSKVVDIHINANIGFSDHCGRVVLDNVRQTRSFHASVSLWVNREGSQPLCWQGGKVFHLPLNTDEQNIGVTRETVFEMMNFPELKQFKSKNLRGMQRAEDNNDFHLVLHACSIETSNSTCLRSITRMNPNRSKQVLWTWWHIHCMWMGATTKADRQFIFHRGINVLPIAS